MSEISNRLKREPRESCACESLSTRCQTELLASQVAEMERIAQAGSVVTLDHVVGFGQSLCMLLAPLVVDGCRVAVLVVAPCMIPSLERHYLCAREHLRVPTVIFGDHGHVVPGTPSLHVVSSRALSRPDGEGLLRGLDPDLVLVDADGMRNLSATKSVSFSRFSHYLTTRPGAWARIWQFKTEGKPREL